MALWTRSRCVGLVASAIACTISLSASAQQGRFDLLGPNIDVHVTRGDQSLPIASVPNLQSGDKLQVHADLPASQSVHLLLVVAFLRGTTNPPPDKWFTRVETWNKKIRAEGVTVTVPPDAEQALLFIAPETGGDFSTLKNAVQGRPGTFVRASQDLNEASFEQSRIERYVQALQRVDPNSSAQLLDHSRKLAATLNLKTNDECFKKPASEQLGCLRQTGTALLLDDGHGQSMAQLITTGDTSNLIGAVQGTPMVANTGAAAYSAYVGTVLDVVRLMTGLRTPHFQYIPAIAFPNADALNLRLNTAPSFHDPKSVIVIALPAIQKAVPPPLQLQDPNHVSCLLQPHMVLPLSGAPLVFATGFAHDLVLHLDQPGPDGRVDLPLTPDAFEGGLVVADGAERKPLGASAPPARESASQETRNSPEIAQLGLPVPGMKPASAATGTSNAGGVMQVHGTVRGYWGFDAFKGPTVPLQRLPGQDWTAAPRTELFAGRTNTLVLRSSGVGCTENIAVQGGDTPPLAWRTDPQDGPDTLNVKLPLERIAPGSLTLSVRQFGEAVPQKVSVVAYSDVTRVQDFRIHAGDAFATVTGTGLNEVKSAAIEGWNFGQAQDASTDGKYVRLNLDADAHGDKGKKKPAFKDGDHGTALLALRDGRSLSVPYSVDSARPAVTILNRNVASNGNSGLPLTLSNSDALPLRDKLTIALRSDSPSKFSRSEKVEIATTDGALHTELNLSDGTLVLEDSHTALGFLQPDKAFGASAFGPLQLRVVTSNSASDWQPLGLLVRTPSIQAITCGPRSAASRIAVVPEAGGPAVNESACTLTGSNLFLIASTSADAAFTAPAELPPGFAADTLQVPRPTDGHTLYLKLRDDPDHVITVPVEAVADRARAR